MKSFLKKPCRRCGRLISNCGFAYTRHDVACKKKAAEAAKAKAKEGEHEPDATTGA